MRPQHLINLGYTPTDKTALMEIAELLLVPSSGSGEGVVTLLDPTCGDGEALAYLAQTLQSKGAKTQTYGVELAPERYKKARQVLDHALLADVVSNALIGKGFSLVFLNPPYDNTGGENSVERQVIRLGLRALIEEGVAILVVPQRLLQWLGRFRMEWLSLFPTNDPESPGQVVLIGKKGDKVTPIPEMGTKSPVVVPLVAHLPRPFRVKVMLQHHLDAVAQELEWPDRFLYGSDQVNKLTTLHPVGAGHKAVLLVAHRATVPLDGNFLRVTATTTEDTKVEVDEEGKKRVVVTRRPEVFAFLLRKEGKLERIPLSGITNYVDDVQDLLNVGTYVSTDANGYPLLEEWEERELQRVGARLPPMGKHQGLFPPQATRAVAMARALLAGEKAVLGIMEMGYGKTPISLTALALVRAKRKVGLTVVLCPPHLVTKWEREAKRLHPDAAVVVPRGGGEDRIRMVRRAIALARQRPVILVLSREHLKLGPSHVVQLVPRTIKGRDGTIWRVWACPHCGEPALSNPTAPTAGEEEDERLGWVLVEGPTPPARFRGKKCPHCGVPYSAAGGRPRRWPLADIIVRSARRGEVPGGLFLIVDEVHEYRNISLQGIAFSRLFRVAKWAILLTGTLFNGKASDLYNLLRWISPEFRREGMSRKEFVEKFGYSEAVREVQEGRTYGRSIRKEQFHERPGVSPLVYRFLFSRTAFGSLRDFSATALPPYKEQDIFSDPVQPFHPDQGGGIWHSLGPSAFMAWLRAALGYNNVAAVQPCDDEAQAQLHVYGYWEHDADGGRVRFRKVLELPVLPQNQMLPKEKQLVEIVVSQKARGRKVVVLVEQTRKRPLAQRLAQILGQAGINAVVLDTERIPAARREEWIMKNAPGMDVLITHPKAVETGLDLVMFQTVVVYEATYSIITLLQALRRVHRLGQTRPVEVFILQYRNTMEVDAWPVIRRGIAWSMTTYGDFLLEAEGGNDPNLSLLSALAQKLRQGAEQRDEGEVSVTLSGFFSSEEAEEGSYQEASQESIEPSPPPPPPPPPPELADLPLFSWAATTRT